MSSIIIDSTIPLDDVKTLIASNIPSYRQAYSDRTAWLMACISELAYIKFNPFLENRDKKALEKVAELIDTKRKKYLKEIINLVAYDSDEEKKKLIKELSYLNIKLEKTFDSNGTQAIIVSTKDHYILAFRGTEPTSLRDIKSDLDAKIIKCDTGGRVHRGFHKALEEVSTDIQNYLDSEEIEKKSLFITGHSLGGALATLAAKRLTFKYGIAACYTYGSPRTGDEKWVDGLKTSIYRVVNSADPVTMLPPGDEIISIAGWFIKFIPVVGENLKKTLISNFAHYYHAGDMRYLTNIEDDDYKSAKRLFSVSFYRRVKAYFHNKISWKEMPADHSISVYRKKLYEIAKTRQKLFSNDTNLFNIKGE